MARSALAAVQKIIDSSVKNVLIVLNMRFVLQMFRDNYGSFYKFNTVMLAGSYSWSARNREKFEHFMVIGGLSKPILNLKSKPSIKK